MNNNDYESLSPGKLAAFDDELEFLDSIKNEARRVKVDKGHSWVVRFLPVELGAGRRFYGRIAQHWIQRRPIVCPRFTHPDFGGQKDAPCRLCDETERLNRAANRTVSTYGFKCRSNPQWLTYTLVFEKDDGRGNNQVVKGDDRWNPYEFWLNKSIFEYVYSLYRRGLDRGSQHSILDLVSGNDFLVTMTSRELKIQREDSRPITNPENSEKFQQIVDKIWSNIMLPKIQIPSDDEIEMAVQRLHDGVAGLRNEGRQRSGDYDNLGDDDNPPPRRSRDVDDNPPPRRSRDVDVDDDNRRGSGPSQTLAPAPRQAALPSRSVEQLTVASPARVSATKTLPPPPMSRQVQAPPSVSRLVSGGPPAVAQMTTAPHGGQPAAVSGPAVSSVDDDENVTVEETDLAPEALEVPPDVTQDEHGEPPPPIAPPPITAGARSPINKDRLRRGIAAARAGKYPLRLP